MRLIIAITVMTKFKIIWKLLKKRLIRQYHVVSVGEQVVTVGLFVAANAPTAPAASAVLPPAPASSDDVRCTMLRLDRDFIYSFYMGATKKTACTTS